VWICDDYHQRATKGLGFIRGHGDVPSRVWNELAAKCPASLPPNRDLFTSLAGDTDYRTVQRDGIAWDYIKYESPELSAVLTDPRHGLRREGRISTKYKVVRDPYRLAEISLSITTLARSSVSPQPLRITSTRQASRCTSTVSFWRGRASRRGETWTSRL
jgi:hypothetical protein